MSGYSSSSSSSEILDKRNHPASREEVGTETIIDKSKSVKTSLMRLFAESGNYDVEGVDSKNACYGGTAALLNSVAWIESSAYDGRYALVVMGDIAVYEKGPARPTGGAGAVAILVGPEAPIVLEGPLRASYMEDTNDFYKPNMNSEFPIVNGQLSLKSYLKAFSATYSDYLEKQRKYLDGYFFPDYFVFHCPYGKLIQKTFARKYFIELEKSGTLGTLPDELLRLSQAKHLDAEQEKFLESRFIQMSRDMFNLQTGPSLECSRILGNIYSGSLYAALLSLLSSRTDSLIGSRIAMFSYGSGLASTFFSLKVIASPSTIVEKVSLFSRLDRRLEFTPEKYHEVLSSRVRLMADPCSYTPSGNFEILEVGSYYLDKIDQFNYRHYLKRL